MGFLDQEINQGANSAAERRKEFLKRIIAQETERRQKLFDRMVGLRLSGDIVGPGWRASDAGGSTRNVGEEIARQNEINMARTLTPENFAEILAKGDTQVNAIRTWRNQAAAESTAEDRAVRRAERLRARGFGTKGFRF